jgi:hypothetical protein
MVKVGLEAVDCMGASGTDSVKVFFTCTGS